MRLEELHQLTRALVGEAEHYPMLDVMFGRILGDAPEDGEPAFDRGVDGHQVAGFHVRQNALPGCREGHKMAPVVAKSASALREIRTRLGLSQAECATALGVAVETFRTWDADRRPAPEAIVNQARTLKAKRPSHDRVLSRHEYGSGLGCLLCIHSTPAADENFSYVAHVAAMSGLPEDVIAASQRDAERMLCEADLANVPESKRAALASRPVSASRSAACSPKSNACLRSHRRSCRTNRPCRSCP